ncbi:doubled CXXCH domain-containing protein [Carboxydocella sporoproducens DSM 16521]|uniref:Doubled CXXCH domain-containing protein n=2 Tax=Carboxydocella TaxID=178898 RepID=A0A1T4MLT8_9FIRM|nr:MULTISPECIES: cytochrome c3 family protein [Carboxydocella]AVX21382.1 doubled CXXCH domain-containing protein [Carboxydocella thermautotrophica]SJZ67807.1 doubled CXXCH domain-containing protein [Carboxydocella sporoproducens DSM 16521]
MSIKRFFLYINLFIVLCLTEPAEAKWTQATTAQCNNCHTNGGLTVNLYTNASATTPLGSPVNISTGTSLTFYVKVSGAQAGSRIGAGVVYPAGATPTGNQANPSSTETWTVYTPVELRLSNGGAFGWNSKNVNMTRDFRTKSTDITDSDNNGWEVIPGILNVPTVAVPGTYNFLITGGATNGRYGSVSLQVVVTDGTKPNQITDLDVEYKNSQMTLRWTTPDPPDNSGSISSFKIYRSTDPITNTIIDSLTPVATISGTSGGTSNTWNDPDSASLVDGQTYYYAVLSVDAAGNQSIVSTGPKTSAAKTTANIPTANMRKPDNGSTVRGTVTLKGNATDDVGVTSVTFEVASNTSFTSPTVISGATRVSGTARDGLWQVNWDARALSGTYYVRMKASDGTNTGTSGYFTYTVDNNAPTNVNMVSPANLSTLTNVVQLQASGQDNYGIDRVDFQVSQTSDFSAGVYTFTGATLTSGTITNGTWTRAWSSNMVSNGTWYIRAVFVDKAGNTTYSTAWQYTINNSDTAVPHGTYVSSTKTCAICHSAHAGGSKYLLTSELVNQVCTNCHDGTSAQKAQGFPSTYEHLWDEKDVYCNDCHNPHRNRTDNPPYLLKDTYNSKTTTGVPGDYQLCFNCHQVPFVSGQGYVQSNYDIYQYYRKTSNGGQGTQGVDKGHFVKYSGHTFADGTPIPVGYQLPCTVCHVQHGSNNKILLREQVGTNPNPIVLTSPGMATLSVSEERAFCTGCHNGTTNLYNKNDTTFITWNEYKSLGHTDGSIRCSYCHGGSGTEEEQIRRAAHAPTKGESRGGMDCIWCHNVIQEPMAIGNTADFHHVISNSPNYNQTKNCLQCHVDHDKFRPDLGSGQKRAFNLRTKFDGTSPVAVNTDFINDATGGICLSCHVNAQTKAYNPSKTTRPIGDAAQYNQSKHNYLVYSTFEDSTADNSTKFAANCTKCHNDYDTKGIPYDYQTSAAPFKFGPHVSPNTSILGNLGAVNPVLPLEEDLCYRCHSGSSGKDYYKQIDNSQGAAMSATAQRIQQVFSRTYKHPIAVKRGKHQAVEGSNPGWAPDNGDRHAECQDCHNTHQARQGTSRDGTTFGANGTRDGRQWVDDTISGSLAGTWGVNVTITYSSRGGGNASDKVTYSRTDAPKAQWQICLKCHSDYAWDDGDTSTGNVKRGDTGAKATVPNTSFPFNTTITNTGTGEQPDIGLQFNPGNYAFHPLFEIGLNQPPSNANTNWSSSGFRRASTSTYKGGDGINYPYSNNITPSGLDHTFVDGWGTKSLVTCTDCHASSDDPPDGPHGSSQKWILRKAEPRQVTTASNGVKSLNQPGAYYNDAQPFYNSSGGVTDYRKVNNFCVNCHRADVYGDGTGMTAPPNANLSRFNHGFQTSSDNPIGKCMASGNKVLGTIYESPSCLGCHGGREPGGIHGSVMGVGSGGTSQMGKRFTNGANWVGHTLGQTNGSSVSCWTTSTPDSVAACTKGHSGQSQSPNYYY